MASEQEFSITPAQLRVLAQIAERIADLRTRHEAEMAAVARDHQVALTMVLAGHGEESGSFAGIGGTPEAPTIKVTIG